MRKTKHRAKLNMPVNLGGIRMKNPVMVASGTFGYGNEYKDLVDLNRLGGFISKTLTLHPRLGNMPPRICETPSGMLNSIGLTNVGIEEFLSCHLSYLERFDVARVISIGGESIEEFVQLAHLLDGEKIDGIEINISCPNIGKLKITRDRKVLYGQPFSQNPQLCRKVVRAVRRETNIPLIIKLSPNVTDIRVFARICEDEGADAIALINSVYGMSIDVETGRPGLGNIIGGLSGPAIKPIALKMVWDVYQIVKIPIIGLGGITETEDALEFFLAGASAVAIGSGNFYDPQTSLKIIEGLRKYMEEKRVKNIGEIVGKLKIN